jgi:hypothetical protein
VLPVLAASVSKALAEECSRAWPIAQRRELATALGTDDRQQRHSWRKRSVSAGAGPRRYRQPMHWCCAAARVAHRRASGSGWPSPHGQTRRSRLVRSRRRSVRVAVGLALTASTLVSCAEAASREIDGLANRPNHPGPRTQRDMGCEHDSQTLTRVALCSGL